MSLGSHRHQAFARKKLSMGGIASAAFAYLAAVDEFVVKHVHVLTRSSGFASAGALAHEYWLWDLSEVSKNVLLRWIANFGK